ncbi:hypothetical protein BC940DRAFT_290349 [Gongronella butleri]|nr:hypothetical protein BC940DRAFT_290349 [Gongronella butleri]
MFRLHRPDVLHDSWEEPVHMPVYEGHLHVYTDKGKWKRHLFRFDGVSLICLSTKKVKLPYTVRVDLSEQGQSCLSLTSPLLATPNKSYSETRTPAIASHHQLHVWSVQLTHVQSISLLATKEKAPPCCCIRTNDDTTYVLKASKRKDLDRWLFVLTKAWQWLRNAPVMPTCSSTTLQTANNPAQQPFCRQPPPPHPLAHRFRESQHQMHPPSTTNLYQHTPPPSFERMIPPHAMSRTPPTPPPHRYPSSTLVKSSNTPPPPAPPAPAISTDQHRASILSSEKEQWINEWRACLEPMAPADELDKKTHETLLNDMLPPQASSHEPDHAAPSPLPSPAMPTADLDDNDHRRRSSISLKKKRSDEVKNWMSTTHVVSSMSPTRQTPQQQDDLNIQFFQDATTTDPTNGTAERLSPSNDSLRFHGSTKAKNVRIVTSCVAPDGDHEEPSFQSPQFTLSPEDQLVTPLDSHSPLRTLSKLESADDVYKQYRRMDDTHRGSRIVLGGPHHASPIASAAANHYTSPTAPLSPVIEHHGAVIAPAMPRYQPHTLMAAATTNPLPMPASPTAKNASSSPSSFPENHILLEKSILPHPSPSLSDHPLP